MCVYLYNACSHIRTSLHSRSADNTSAGSDELESLEEPDFQTSFNARLFANLVHTVVEGLRHGRVVGRQPELYHEMREQLRE